MKKNKRRKKNKNTKILLVIIIIVIAIAIWLTMQIKRLMILNQEETTNQISNSEEEQAEENKDNEIITFDTFVDKVYTTQEIENATATQINNWYNANDDKKVDYVRALGNADNENSANNVASSVFKNTNQSIESSKVVAETELYYVVEVKYDYMKQNVSKRNTQKVIVFKSFYYNASNEKFNLDDIQNIKIILDLKNYVENSSNEGKRYIQSFIEKNGKKCEYNLYYLNVNYGQEGKNDTVDLMKETVTIDIATGKIENTQSQAIKNNIGVK